MYRVILKACCLLGVAPFLFLGSVVLSSAQEAPAMQRREFPTWKFKIGSEERLRYEYKHDFDFKRSSEDNGSLIFNRFRINAQACLSDEYLNDIAEAFVEGLDARVGAYQIKPTVQKSSFDLHQAYVDLYNILGSDFDFKVGRQELRYGAGRLIWNPTWANRVRSFDAAILHYHPKNFYCDILFGWDVKYDDNNFNHIQYKEKLTGMYLGYQKDKVSTLLEGYFLPQITKSTAGKTVRYTTGARAQGRVPGNILYDIELPYQFGKTNHKSIKAHALHVDISHPFLSTLWQPNVIFEYNHATGDTNPNDSVNNTFNPLYQSTHEPYGLLDFFRWQNMREAALRVDLALTDKLKLTPQTNFFWLMSTNDSWYDSGGIALRSLTIGRRSHYVGQEVSLRATYNLNKTTKWETGYAHMFPGKYVTISGSNDDVDWVYSQLNFKY